MEQDDVLDDFHRPLPPTFLRVCDHHNRKTKIGSVISHGLAEQLTLMFSKTFYHEGLVSDSMYGFCCIFCIETVFPPWTSSSNK